MDVGYRTKWFFVLWLLGLAASDAAALELKDTLKRVKPSVVGIGTFMRLSKVPSVFPGTGFAVADGRHVITNHHVVDKELDYGKKETFAVFVPRGRKAPRVLPAEIVLCDKRHDLCLLELKGRSRLPPLALGHDADVEEGECHAMTGFPIGMVLGLHPVTHEGIVSAITPNVIPRTSAKELTSRMIRSLNARFDVFQLDAVAYPGNSGSPLYEVDTGKVVGVVNSVFVKDTKEAVLERPSGISYAIPVSHVRELLRKKKLKP